MLSNFLGLAIILGGLQFFMDARSIWEDDDSFIRSDYMVINKRSLRKTPSEGKQALQPMNLRR